MKTITAGTLMLLFLMAGCRTADVATVDRGGEVGEPVLAEATAVPAETNFMVELNTTLGTEVSEVGEHFTATVVEPVYAANGQVAIPRGATVHGMVTGLDDSDHVGDQAAIRLDIQSVEVNGRHHDLSVEIEDVDVETSGQGNLERNAGVGAGAGAVLGAVLGGDLLDILEGAVLGAGAGTAISLGMGDVQATLPAGTRMTLETRRPVNVR